MKLVKNLNFKPIGDTTLISDRGTWLLKLKFVKGRCYESYNTKEVKKEHKAEAKSKEETTVAAEEEQEALVLLVTHLSNILLSIFSNVKTFQQSAYLQFKWTLCAQILFFAYFQGSYL